MQISYNWLKNYLPNELEIAELSEILTSIGLEVESVEKQETIPGGLEGLVTGQVLTCIPHPNADKLKVTTVDIGNQTLLSIVCGAPNVAAGQKVIVATVGTMVHPVKGDAFEIKKAKIRGEISEGMICAEDEIGLGESHAGIMLLPEDTVPGISAKQLFNIQEADHTFHIGLTPNRSDAMSHIGVARDVSAYLHHHNRLPMDYILSQRKKYQKTDISLEPEVDVLSISLEVKDKEACPLYTGIVMTGIQVATSPDWLQDRLKAIGQRPVNNIVDITNFVLHEYGQPLHAFDYDHIRGHNLIVRKAAEGETFITLDGVERKLTGADLMICDTEQAMCIGGVFGGIQSGVTDNTTSIFLESAFFDPRTIRRTSLHHQLRTEAATHFEKTVDIDYVVPALKRAVELIREIAGGKTASALVEEKGILPTKKAVTVTYDYINRVCGKTYDKSAVNSLLLALGFEINEKTKDSITLTVPSNKADVSQPADIAEEVLRVDGLNNVPLPAQLKVTLQKRKEPAERKWKQVFSTHLAGMGFQEIVTNSITNSKYYPGNATMVHMINNLSSELDVMRPGLLESGLEVIAYNANRKQQDLKLYEIGDVYGQKAIGEYYQKSRLGIWLSGQTESQQWQTKATGADIYYLKGVVNSLFERCGLKRISENINGRLLQWQQGKRVFGSITEIDASRLKTFDIRQKVYYAEVYLDTLVEAVENNKIKYAELPRFPAVKRDLSLVVDKAVSYQKVHTLTATQKLHAMQQFELFDVFENEKLGAGKKSLALSFTFQLFDRTLTDEEVEVMMKQLIQVYQKDLQAQVRE